jgi:hypothetical protein
MALGRLADVRSAWKDGARRPMRETYGQGFGLSRRGQAMVKRPCMRARGGLPRYRPRLRRKLDALGATKRPSAPRFKLRAGLRLWMPMARVQRRGSRQHGINRRLYGPWGVRGECAAISEVATTRSLQSNNGMQRTGCAGR